MNSGKLQATVAYKVSERGEPLDIYGVMTSVSGRRQAIAILEGYNNPDPFRFEVEKIYAKGQSIQGVPSLEINGEKCPSGGVSIDPSILRLNPAHTRAEVTINSSGDWQILPGFGIVNITPLNGKPGRSYLVVDLISGEQGYENIQVRNNQTGVIGILKIYASIGENWVLETGEWDNLGIWYNLAIWNYGN